jgi:chemotaxis protein CheD
MKAHIIGGGRNPVFESTIGDENVQVAEEILIENRIEIVTKDVGGATGRKVVFHNKTGEILVYKGINIRESDWYSDNGK